MKYDSSKIIYLKYILITCSITNIFFLLQVFFIYQNSFNIMAFIAPNMMGVIFGYAFGRISIISKNIRNTATHDSLTGLRNRMWFEDIMLIETQKATRYDNKLSAVLFDIDKFKKINDSFGHIEGDKVLAEIGKAVADTIRSSDFAVRWGGDEILVILPLTDIKGAILLAVRIRNSIMKIKFSSIGSAHCSFGVTEYISGESPAVFLDRVDNAMYMAKSEGRNKIKHISIEPKKTNMRLGEEAYGNLNI